MLLRLRGGDLVHVARTLLLNADVSEHESWGTTTLLHELWPHHQSPGVVLSQGNIRYVDRGTARPPGGGGGLYLEETQAGKEIEEKDNS